MDLSLHIRAVSVFALLLANGLLNLPAHAHARAFIDMGPKDQIAGHQPQAQIKVFSNDGVNSFGPGGPSDDPLGGIFGTTSTLLVDTGASSIFLMNDAESIVRDNGYVVENQVFEQGVSGFSLVNVSAPYQAHITDDLGNTHVITDNRMLSGQFPDLFGVNGLIGMPGMVGRVMSMDLDVAFDPNDIFSFELPKTTFSSTLPTDFGHRYSIPLTAKRFDIEDAEEPLPTSSPLPMITVESGVGSKKESGQFILDTGASISFISSRIANSIGLDTNGDGAFTADDDRHFDDLPIGGVGGTVEAPMFLIDTMGVTTDQNVDLVWDEAFVLVLDIHPDIDGVFGADLVTSGLLNLLGLGECDGEAECDAPTEVVSFDFRNFFEEGDAGKLVYDLNPTYDVVQIPGDFDSDGDVDGNDLALWQTEFADGVQDGASFLEWQRNFDPSLAGTVGHADFLDWQRAFGANGGIDAAIAIPEPDSLLLLLLATALCARLSRSKLHASS